MEVQWLIRSRLLVMLRGWIVQPMVLFSQLTHMFAEVDVAAGGWEQVKKKHSSNKHSRKKLSVVAADASAGPALLAEKSKSIADLNGLNSELDVGLAAGIAGASAGNSVGLKSASVLLPAPFPSRRDYP
ncbi:hypothetical protein OIU84_002880 [Salix udensis]|uniref:Uncharacterized protein n=1 Tax=Salix udensis TaxID=889485 RepID=A0AAD6P579_9ROSI|nr:hypothetical protein OIU84_002880 [Salix udensis]